MCLRTQPLTEKNRLHALQTVASLRGARGGNFPPSLSKTVSEIRPDPLRFVFEGWGGVPLNLDFPAAGLLFCFLFCKT